MNNKERLLADLKSQIEEFNLADGSIYLQNVELFFTQCKEDSYLDYAMVKWDGEKEFDFLWDSPYLDCRFSIGTDETTWHFWSGINHHSKDDECWNHGVGGDKIESCENFFADTFFELMECTMEDIKKETNK